MYNVIRAGTPDGFAPTVYDVTPTVLRLVGLPAAEDMEGDVLADILVGAPPLPAVASYGSGDSVVGEPLPSEADEAMLERLRAMQECHPTIGDVRGMGLMVAVELVKDRQSKERAPEL